MDTNEPVVKRRFANIPSLTLLLVIVLAMGAAVYLKSQSRAQTTNKDIYDVRLQNLENTVLQQETRLKQLEDNAAKPQAATPPTPAQAAPAPAAPASTAAAPADYALQQERIAALEKDLAAFKASAPLQDKEKLYHSIRLLSAFHRLSARVLSGKPFATELAEFEDLTGEDPALEKPIAAISPYADNGIPTFAVLLATFDEAMESLKTDESVPPPGASLWQRIVYNFTHMVTVRRIDDAQKGNSVSAILGRAQAHLDVQETQAAITEVASLPDDARSHFTSWLEDAQLATQAGDLMAQIEEAVMQKAFYTEGTPATPAQPSAPASASPAAPADTAPKAE